MGNLLTESSTSSFPNTLSKKCYNEKLCDALPELVPFVQFRKHKKHPWKSVTVTAYNLTKSDALPWVFSRFFFFFFTESLKPIEMSHKD